MACFAGIIRFDRSARARRDLERLSRLVGLSLDERIFSFGSDLCSFASSAPITRSADGRVALFEGRLVDGGASRSQDHPAQSDAASLLDGWDRKGDDIAANLQGDYTAALWHPDRPLRLITSPASRRTLYYYRSADCVVFATQLRILMALPDVPREIDDVGLADLLAVNLDPSDRTVWAGVHRVSGGCAAVIDANGVRIERWWDIRNAPEVRFRTDGDYVEAARHLFDLAVSACASGTKPLVVAMSGGLDSAPIAATLTRQYPQQTINTLTLVSPPAATYSAKYWRYVDDRPYIAALKERWPQFTGELIEAEAPDKIDVDATGAFIAAQTPLAQSTALGWLLPLYRRAASLGADTLLTGGLGDATFSFDGLNLLPQLLRSGRVIRFIRELRALGLAGPHPASRYVRGAVRQAFEPLVLRNWRHRSKPGGIGDWVNYVGVNRDFAEATSLQSRLMSNSFPGGDDIHDGGVRSVLDYFLKRDRFSSELAACLREMTGVSMASPYADRRVLEFCAGLPFDQFMREGQTRWLARRMFADRLPSFIVQNRLKGEQRINWFETLTARRPAILQQIEAFGSSPLAARVLDLKRLKRLAENWPSDVATAHRRHTEYRGLLARAVHIGQFLRWVDPTNSRVNTREGNNLSGT